MCIGKKDEAFSFFLRGVQANPRNIEAQFGLGQIYLYTQNLIDAERCFELCKTILDENKAERHIRGGMATKLKYEKEHKK